MAASNRHVTGGFRSIVCAVDFSLPSYAALDEAVRLARRSGGRVTAVCVEDPLTSSGAAARGYDVSLLRRSTLNRLKRLVERTATPAGLGPERWSVDVLLGTPAPTIISVARTSSADLIVIGSNGRRGPAKWFFGSVAQAVLRRTPVPVLVVARRRTTIATARNETILGAIELGAHDRVDARRIAAAASMFGGRLSFVHVVRPSDSPSGEAAATVHYGRQVAAARSRLQVLAKTVGASVRVVPGKPDIEIAAAATGMRAHVIVLVLRRGRGIFGARQGSTTYRVLCSSRIPVLALPPA